MGNTCSKVLVLMILILSSSDQPLTNHQMWRPNLFKYYSDRKILVNKLLHEKKDRNIMLTQ